MVSNLRQQGHEVVAASPSSGVNTVTDEGLNGLFLFGNGLFILVDPSAWYRLVPGVMQIGPFNQHFVRDIGLIQMFLGAAFGIGWLLPASRFVFLECGDGVAPCACHFAPVGSSRRDLPSIGIGRDFPAVTLPALIGIALTALAWRTRDRSS